MSQDFAQLQRQFAAHLRDPQQPAPAAIEERRLRIYRDLFFNNIEGFLRQSFPVCQQLLARQQHWQPLVRRFFAEHTCHSPHFVDIPRQFLDYLLAAPLPPHYPAFLAELAHYEWLELALETATECEELLDCEPDVDLLADCPVLTPVFAMPDYHWPVQLIGPEHQPEAPLTQPQTLLLFRNRELRVSFLVINQATRQLIEQLIAQPEANGYEHVRALLPQLPGFDEQRLCAMVLPLLSDWRQRGFILGTRPRSNIRSNP